MQAVAAEPFDAALLRELVDLGRAAPGVDRAAHQGHAGGGCRVAVGLHQRRRREQRHRRLANSDRVHAWSEMSENLTQIDDVVVEIEGPQRQRHHARIGPVGDVHVVVGQEGLDRAAKQGRVMARHRRDDQELRLNRAGGEIRPGEMQEIAERPGPDDLLQDRIEDSVHVNVIKPEGRLAVAARQALEQLRPGRDVLAQRRVGERVPGIAEHQTRRVRHRARRRQSGVSHLVQLVGIGWGHEDGPIWRDSRQPSSLTLAPQHSN